MNDPAATLDELRAAGLARRRRINDGSAGVRLVVEERALLAFASNDYLGLAADPRVIEAMVDGARRYGAGAGASHLVSGHHRPHHELEERLARFVGLPRALLLSSGYAANLAVLSTLADAGSAIFADRLNHASLNDGMLLSRARFHRYRHGDVEDLVRRLRQASGRTRIVVTDAVFSMDGDIAPLADLAALCAHEGAWLVVDDAHGFGVLGPQGRGALTLLENVGPQVVYMGTLGKAAGVCGAFVAAAPAVIELLVQRARTYIYTTALPPAVAHALLTSLEILEREDWRRDRLQALVTLLRARVSDSGLDLLPSRTPIQPIVIGDAHAAVEFAAALERLGIFVPAIRPPTVARGTARLRVSLSALHSEADVERLTAALAKQAGTRG